MPYYTFINKETEEEFDDMMSMSEKDKFLEDNPNIKQKLSTPNLADSVRLGVTKPKIEHRELLNNMHKKLGAPGIETTVKQTY